MFRFAEFAPFFLWFDTFLHEMLAGCTNALAKQERPQKRARLDDKTSLSKDEGVRACHLYVYQLTLHALRHPLGKQRTLHNLIELRRAHADVHPSHVQQVIAKELRQLGYVLEPSFHVEEEVWTSEGISIDVLLRFRHGYELFVEINGPFHYLRETSICLAKTLWKQDMMRRFARPLLNISVFEWRRLHPHEYATYLISRIQPFVRVHQLSTA